MNGFDIINFLKTAAIALPALLTIVMPIVTLIGKFGVSGKPQLIASLLVGLVLGILTMYFTISPASAVAWFSTCLFGLLVGLAASGCYEVLKESRN